MSQKTDLQDYFKSHDALTQEQAKAKLGIARLAARILDLEAIGMRFLRNWLYVPSRRKHPARVMQYIIVRGAA